MVVNRYFPLPTPGRIEDIPQYLDEELRRIAAATAPISVTTQTFEPTLSADTVPGDHSYTAQSGISMQIGPIVIATFDVFVNVLDAAINGNLRITGFPVAAAADSDEAGVALSRFGGLVFPAGITQVMGRIRDGSSFLSILAGGNDKTHSIGFDHTTLSGTNAFCFSGTVMYKGVET